MDLYFQKCTNCGKVLPTDVNPPAPESWGLGCSNCAMQEDPDNPYLWNLLGTITLTPPA